MKYFKEGIFNLFLGKSDLFLILFMKNHNYIKCFKYVTVKFCQNFSILLCFQVENKLLLSMQLFHKYLNIQNCNSQINLRIF